MILRNKHRLSFFLLFISNAFIAKNCLNFDIGIYLAHYRILLFTALRLNK